MSSRVGAKGNIVIDKEIRDRLGVMPGWETVQLLRNGHVEVHFLPPLLPGASAGIWRTHLMPGSLPTQKKLIEAVREAYAEAAVERYERSLEPGCVDAEAEEAA